VTGLNHYFKEERMLIELWRQEENAFYSMTCCAICGDDFELGSVYVMVSGDRGQDLGEMCPTCLDYLNRRKADGQDPARGNRPSRDWPTVKDLEEARRRYPEPIPEDEDDIVVWRMERERV
jgi:hypothetical protein